MEPWLRSVGSIRSILADRDDLRDGLEISIQKAGIPEVRSIAQFFEFLEKMLTEIPTRREMSPAVEHFHYLVSGSPENILNKDPVFTAWLVEFAKDHGRFLDTTASAKALDTFIRDPEYHIEEYEQGPSGWMTFNQFFARRVKPGKRPVAAPCDDAVIVSATDSVYLGCWPIDGNATVTAKGVAYPIMELLDGSPFAGSFSGGLFTHSYLDVTDYHRYHVPVRGLVREARKIPGNVIVEIGNDGKGGRKVKDEVGFQFKQARGILIIESPVGLVAVLPIGMGHTSSVNITAGETTVLAKGEEFGYFCQGGSDMVMLFEPDRVEFTATPGVHYRQGEAIARSSGRS